MCGRAARSFDAAQSQPMTWLTSWPAIVPIDSLRRSSAQPQVQHTSSNDNEDSDVYDTVAGRGARPRSNC